MPAIPHTANPVQQYPRARAGQRLCPSAMSIRFGATANAPGGARRMDRNETETAGRRFITENFPLGDSGSELAGGDSLLEAGGVDSGGGLRVIEFLEARYALNVPGGGG